jgi:hypothetical protein
MIELLLEMTQAGEVLIESLPIRGTHLPFQPLDLFTDRRQRALACHDQRAR